jgi:hypothetical protein
MNFFLRVYSPGTSYHSNNKTIPYSYLLMLLDFSQIVFKDNIKKKSKDVVLKMTKREVNVMIDLHVIK